MSHVRSTSIIAIIDDHLDKIQDAFRRAFAVDGYGGLFADYWLVISPRHFMLDDMAAIDQYYLKQVENISKFLAARGNAGLAEQKIQTLKTLGVLCYQLAKFKYAIKKSLLICAPDKFISASQGLQEMVGSDFYLGQDDSRFGRQEMVVVDNYFYLLGSHLFQLGYLSADKRMGVHVQDGLSLPLHLQKYLNELKSNDQLNEMIDRLEDARKRKQSEKSHKNELLRSIDEIIEAKNNIENISDQVVARYEQSTARVGNATQKMTIKLQAMQQYEHIFKLVAALNELNESLQFSGFKKANDAAMAACKGNRSSLSIAVMGMISDPWAEAEKILAGLNQLDSQIKMFADNYSVGNMSVAALHRQYRDFKQKAMELCVLHQAMSQKLGEVHQAVTDYMLALDNTSQILRGHVESHSEDTILGFGSRHWLKMTGGGLSGAGVAVFSLFLTTNPVLLATVIVAGGVLGTVGGAGGGLVQDMIVDNAKEKKSAASTNPVHFGSFWHREQESTTSVTEPTVVKAGKP